MNRPRDAASVAITARRLRLLVVGAALAAAFSFGGGSLGVSPLQASDTFTIVDTLPPATPTTVFDPSRGASGLGIAAHQYVGPQFTLTQETVITEIGGFIASINGSLPITVQIRPSVNGIPDLFSVLATFALTTDNDPFLISYESATPNLTLGAGSYYALFAPQDGGDGYLLSDVYSPFEYHPGSTTMGYVNPVDGRSGLAGFDRGAVRILGRSARDTTPPIVTVPQDISINATSPAGASVDYTVTATDDVDPSPTLICTPPSGSVFAIGDTLVECTATDAAGNTASASFTVHVKGAIEQVDDLIVLLDSYQIAGKHGQSLHQTLVAARNWMLLGKRWKAGGKLDSFLKEVKNQTGKALTVEQANGLTLRAERIKDVLDV